MNYTDYPWYFECNGVFEAWDITRGENVDVYIADTCIDKTHKAFSDIRIQDEQQCGIKKPDKLSESAEKFEEKFRRYIHGTAITGLIAGSYNKLNIDPSHPLPDSFGNKISVSGIAPKSSVIAFEGTRLETIEKMFTFVTEKSVSGKSLFPIVDPVKITLINISGGDGYVPSLASHWKDIISRKCDSKEADILIIAGVGNDGLDLDQSKQILPGNLLALRSCKNDIFLRVGGTNQYDISSAPNIWKGYNSGSNYGQLVEILAPAAAIPIITPENYGSVASGTSESTAIVTSLAVLLASCNPSATAQEIKEAILENADTYDHLKGKVRGGNVLNIKNAVTNFCIDNGSVQNNVKKNLDEF